MSLHMGTDSTKPTLLLVEDEIPLLTLLRRYLERLGYTVHTAETGQAAIEAMQQYEPQAVVLDLGLPDMPGVDVLAKILDQNQTSRVLVSSGTPFSNEILPEAQRQRVGALQKPYLPKTLIDSVEDLIAGRLPQNSG